MKQIRNIQAVLLGGALALIGSALAADALPLAKVNGVAIPARLVERNVQANVAQGQVDSQSLRAALTEELIARELMVQEAVRRGLDKRQSTEDAVQALRQNLLIDLLMQDELSRKPVAEEDLKAEYERQVRLLSAGDAHQYQVASIVVESEADARAVLASLRAGQGFESLAKAKSLDASRERGGEMGWLLPEQIAPAISNVVVNLSINAVSVAPIQVGSYWHVVKLLGKRDYQIPGYAESKSLVQAAVLQARRTALLKRLLETAKITR